MSDVGAHQAPVDNEVGGLAFLTLRFDATGDVDAPAESAVRSALAAEDFTDVIVFSHGWHQSPTMANALYMSFFGRLAPLLLQHAPDRKALLLGVVWPARAWSDEPIPEFEACPDLGSAAGSAAGLSVNPLEFPPPPAATAEDRETMRSTFDEHLQGEVDELVDLLAARPDSVEDLERAKKLIGLLSLRAESTDDGEGLEEPGAPMAVAPPDEAYDELTLALERQGVVRYEEGGAAGLGSSFGRLWDGVQQAARQLTYYQMKNRAGIVGEQGLGPFLRRLLDSNPGLGLHLVGHSFGARLVSYSLKALPVTANGVPPVRGVTLLQAAFSHFAFAPTLPFEATRSGALAGQEAKVSGKVVACYSKFDDAVGTMYPLASFVRGQDAAGIEESAVSRWGGMGHDGHQTGVAEVALGPPGTPLKFGAAGLVNIDCHQVVRRGRPPAGAHSDIVHDELAWVVLSAGGLVGSGGGRLDSGAFLGGDDDE